MTTFSTDRITRRRSVIFTVLVSITLVLMALSSNPFVRDLQNGLGFAFRPIQGALDDVASGIASIGAAVSEIDRLRVDNGALRAENDQLTVENARLRRSPARTNS
jgi:cell shape-determining protein MreC